MIILGRVGSYPPDEIIYFFKILIEIIFLFLEPGEIIFSHLNPDEIIFSFELRGTKKWFVENILFAHNVFFTLLHICLCFEQ